MAARRVLLFVLVLWIHCSHAGPSTDYALVARWPVASGDFPISAGRPLALGGQRLFLLGRGASSQPGLPAGTSVDKLFVYAADRSLVHAIELQPVGARAVVADSADRAYVLTGDSPSRLSAHAADGSLLWSVEAIGAGVTGAATDLALSEDRLFVRFESRVLVYDALSGEKRAEWGSRGTGNGLPGELVGTGAIAADPGTVFTSVQGHLVGAAIDAYTVEGQFLRRVAVTGPIVTATAGTIYAGGSRLSALATNAQPTAATMLSLGRHGADVGSFAIRGDRLFAAVRNAANRPEIREFRQSAGFVPGDDAPAFPQPSLVAQAARGGQTVLDLQYRVDDLDSASVQTALLVRVGASNHVMNWRRPVSLIEGTAANVGLVASNTVHAVAWDFGADFPAGGDAIDLSIEVLALDGRGLLGFGLVSLPAGIPEGAASTMAITAIALRRSDFLDAYAWLFASGDPAVEMVNGQLLGTASSGFPGMPLALDRAPVGPDVTSEGVAYLLAREGLRRATADEVARARQGSTPGQTNRFTPVNGAGSRPEAVNEYGIETSDNIDLIYAVSDP